MPRVPSKLSFRSAARAGIVASLAVLCDCRHVQDEGSPVETDVSLTDSSPEVSSAHEMDDAPEIRSPVGLETPRVDSPGSSGSGEEQGESAEETFRRLLAGMGVQYFREERKLEVAGRVNMQRGLVEVFACAPGGKTHEAVVVLDCVPSGLHAGLLALGLKPGTAVELGTSGGYKPPTGDRVEIQIRWPGEDGRVHTARAEEWVWNQTEGRPMRSGPWIFAGSFMQRVAGDPEEVTYAANYVKSLVTTHHDATSILENPYPEGIDDTVYYANEKAVPPVGTPVTGIFSAFK